MLSPISTAAPLSPQTIAYNRVQQVLGEPIESLQVDNSVNSLGEAVEYHIEMVQALLRRLYSVVGDHQNMDGEVFPESIKVPLASRIDHRRDAIRHLTAEVESTIRALQI